jgi:hypothetical protein
LNLSHTAFQISEDGVGFPFQFPSISLNTSNSVSIAAARFGMKISGRTTVAIGMKILYMRRIVVENGSTRYILILDSKNRGSRRVLIPGSITVLAADYLYQIRETEIITFESQTRLTRIESEAFSSSSFESIEIPRNVEILGSSCFSQCKSLSSI